MNDKKIKICDAVCGAGKTQSSIKMINEDKSNNYIFITPYLTEVERIKKSCKEKNFKSPEQKFTTDFSKLKHLNELLKAKKNIVTTHSLFSNCTDETLKLIQDGNYILILDEVLDIYKNAEIHKDDVDMLVKADIMKINENGEYEWIADNYNGDIFSEIKSKAKSNSMCNYNNEIFFWSVPPKLFEHSKETYILTYMFKYQIQRYFLDVNGFEYEYIGTRINSNGEYEFCDVKDMDRKLDIRNKIHILDGDKYKKLNAIGNERCNLSLNWFKKHSEVDKGQIKILKNNLYNFYRNKCPLDSKKRMWTTFKEYESKLKHKGYLRSFVPFNARAMNDFADRKYLAYCLNVYMPTWAKAYLQKKGAENISEEMFAISTLVQWIFRSAIRTGEEIYLYLPSKRMRTIFTKWLDNLAEGKDLDLIKYTERKTER